VENWLTFDNAYYQSLARGSNSGLGLRWAGAVD